MHHVGALQALHVEETKRLQAEVAALHKLTALQPYPRMSPPVFPIAREDSRRLPSASEKGLVRESCTLVEKDEDEPSTTDCRAEVAEAEQPVPNKQRRNSRHSGTGSASPKFKKGFSASSLMSSLMSMASLHSNQAIDLGEDSGELVEVNTREADRAFYERFGNVFLGNTFEMGIAVILLLNLLLMAAQLQYDGLKFGYEIGYKDYLLPAEEYWPNVASLFVVGDIIFAVIFTVEMLIRLFWIRCLAFFRHWLNWILGRSWRRRCMLFNEHFDRQKEHMRNKSMHLRVNLQGIPNPNIC